MKEGLEKIGGMNALNKMKDLAKPNLDMIKDIDPDDVMQKIQGLSDGFEATKKHAQNAFKFFQ